MVLQKVGSNPYETVTLFHNECQIRTNAKFGSFLLQRRNCIRILRHRFSGLPIPPATWPSLSLHTHPILYKFILTLQEKILEIFHLQNYEKLSKQPMSGCNMGRTCIHNIPHHSHILITKMQNIRIQLVPKEIPLPTVSKEIPSPRSFTNISALPRITQINPLKNVLSIPLPQTIP